VIVVVIMVELNIQMEKVEQGNVIAKAQERKMECEECGEFKEVNDVGICKGCEKWLLHFYQYKKYEEKMDEQTEIKRPVWTGFSKKEKVFWIAIYGFVIFIILILAAWLFGLFSFAIG